MVGRAAAARVLSALALFSVALLLMPALAAAATGVITSPGPLSQIFITDTLGCQVAYAGDPEFEFFPSTSTEGDCGTFVAVGGSVWGPVGASAAISSFTIVSQSPVTGSGTQSDPFRIVTVVSLPEAGLQITETDSYAVGSRAYRTDIQIANGGNAAQTGVLYRGGDCYLQGNDAGFVRVDGGSPSCIVNPALGRRVEQWLPITVGSRYFAGYYGSVWSQIGSQALFTNTCDCNEQFAFDNGAGLSWPFNVAPGASAVFAHETFFSPVGGSPGSVQSFTGSVPDPTRITLDPVVVAQSVAVTAGVILLVPFPSALFNNTLEENYTEVMGWVARIRAGLGRTWARLVAGVRRKLAERHATSAAAPAGSPPSLTSAPTAPAVATEKADIWRGPAGVGLLVVLTALLYAFLDPTFGFSLESLATLAGLALGLFIILAAYAGPLLFLSRRDRFSLSVEALPATLIVGVLCVVVSRIADFQPGYLYGLIIGFYFAHGVARDVEGRAEAVAAASSLIAALIAWVALAFIRSGAAPGGDLGTELLSAATVTIVVAGLENAVFSMLPLRFLPGAAVYAWNRPIWIVLLALGLFGFVHVLLNPSAGAGYLADSTRTSFFTLVALLALFGVASVLFWAYFRFRPARIAAAPPEAPAP
ncbi:MAG TPA: FGLLP motif-containing membrane protein [Candidatus Limnocylindria bacterium]|nr:FGLLP motif-containing membrane protein [Candidatus Limnocylindria bacterium]